MKVQFSSKRSLYCDVSLFQFIMIFSWVKYTDMEGDAFPGWSDALGWLMTMTVVVAIVAGAIITVCTAEGSFAEVKYYTIM